MRIGRMLHSFMGANKDDGSDAGGGSEDRGDGHDSDVGAAEKVADVARGEDGKFAKAAASEGEGEGAGEGEGEASEKASEKAAAPEKKERTGKGMIPLDRHEAVLKNARERTEAAERRTAELEAKIAKVGVAEDMKQLDADIEGVEDKLEAARLDGDKEKTRELAKQLRMMERQVAASETGRATGEAQEKAREDMRLDLTIEKLEGQYPMLDEKHAEFDQDIVDMVLATQRDLISRMHMTPSKALDAATQKVMLKVMPASREEGGEEKGGLKDAKPSVDGRKEAQVKKNLDTAKRQPASSREVGLDSDKAGQTSGTLAASALSYDEFSALPEATKAKMRGDLL